MIVFLTGPYHHSMSLAMTYEPGDAIDVKFKHGRNVYYFASCDDLLYDDCLETHRCRGIFQHVTGNVATDLASADDAAIEMKVG
jgi:hypothetical protein